MALIQCGAPARYLRLGFKQVDLGSNGQFGISELAAYDSPSGTVNLLAAATLTLDHVAGVHEVTSPLDANNNPILDGAVLVDGDTATAATVNILDYLNPSPWFVTADFGAGNEKTITEVAVVFSEDHRFDRSKWVIHVETSDDGVSWRRIDSLLLRNVALGVEQRVRVTGAGPLRLREFNPRTGDGFITGIVSEDSAVKPNARVVCLERDTMTPVASACADQYGGFTFWGLDTSRQYTIIALDDDGAPLKQPSSWDHITPTKGLRYGNLAIQTVHNKLEIVGGWHLMGFYQFGQWASDGLGFAAAEWWWDYNYTEPVTYPAGAYGPFTNPVSRTPSPLTPLRPDQPAYLFNSETIDYHQHPVIFMAPDTVADKGLTLEMVVALEPGATAEVEVFGLKTPRYGDWYHPDNYTGNYEAGLYSTNNSRSLGEVLEVDLAATSLTIFYQTSSMSAEASLSVPLPTGVDLSDGVLHHLVVTLRVNDAVEVFIDGTSIATATLAGTGSLVGYIKNNTYYTTTGAYRSNDTGYPAIACGVAISDEFYTSRREVSGIHIANVALYATGVTAAQASNLNQEARGAYTDATAVVSATGHEAEVLARSPSLYMPLQDTSATTLTPVAAYPLPYRTVGLDNRDPGNASYQQLYKQSTIPDQVASGLVTLAHTTAGSSRAWMRVTAGGNPHYAFSHGWGLSSPKERTLEVWLQIVQAPTGSDSIVIKGVTNHEEVSVDLAAPDVPQTIFSLAVDASLGLLVGVQAAAPADVPMYFNFGYTLPLDTKVHLAVTFDYASGSATLYVNGAMFGQLSLGSLMQFDSVGRLHFDVPSGELLVRDLAVYNYALTADEIQTLYNSGG